MSAAGFDFSNLSERPPGRIVSVAGRLLPGVARVQAEAVPWAAAWQRANRAALDAGPEAGPLWVALGDSLTQGLGASSYDRGWVGQLHRRLSDSGVPLRLVNLGVSGAVVEDVAARQLPVLDALPADEIDLVTVMIGSNDLMRRGGRRELPARFAELLERLPRGSVVTTMPNPSQVAGRVNDEIASVAQRRGLVVVEMRDRRTASWRGRLAADHFHPNDLGYAAITDVVQDALLAARPDLTGSHRRRA